MFSSLRDAYLTYLFGIGKPTLNHLSSGNVLLIPWVALNAYTDWQMLGEEADCITVIPVERTWGQRNVYQGVGHSELYAQLCWHRDVHMGKANCKPRSCKTRPRHR